MPELRGAKRWLIVVTGLLLSSILLAACGEGSPSILNPAGPVASTESGVFYFILIVATVIFVLVEGALIYSIIRYRERPGMPRPRQLHGNLRVEIIWTVIPTIVLFLVLGWTIRGLFEVATQPAGNTVEVEVAAHQWWWEFYYPKWQITTADSMVVPADTIIHVRLYSNNVIHSFWVPELFGKTDVIPGHDNEKWFKVDPQNGGKTYLGICTEYCGTQHANMRFNVVATKSQQDFMTWVTTQQQGSAAPAPGSIEAKGKEVFKSAGCTACHGIVGVDLQSTKADDPAVKCDAPTAACLVGPNLTHFGSRTMIAGGVLENNRDECPTGGDLSKCNLARWLHDPQAVKPGNDMKIGQLSDEQISQLVAYLESLK